MSASLHSWAHLSLPTKTNGHFQAHLVLPAKTNGPRQLRLAQPMSAGSRRQPHEVLAQKCKGGNPTGAEEMQLVLPIPLQASAGESAAK
jgi:hypothetical protein